jgi:hypothetical protein
MPKPSIIRKKAEKEATPSYLLPPTNLLEQVAYEQNIKFLVNQPHQKEISVLIHTYKLDLKDGLFRAKLLAGQMRGKFLTLNNLTQLDLYNKWCDISDDGSDEYFGDYLERVLSEPLPEVKEPYIPKRCIAYPHAYSKEHCGENCKYKDK